MYLDLEAKAKGCVSGPSPLYGASQKKGFNLAKDLRRDFSKPIDPVHVVEIEFLAAAGCDHDGCVSDFRRRCITGRNSPHVIVSAEYELCPRAPLPEKLGDARHFPIG